MDNDGRISKLTKVLIKKAHGGRKADSKFWNEQIDLSEPITEKTKKRDKARNNKRPFKVNPYIIGLIIFAIFDMFALQLYATYKETGKLPFLDNVTVFWSKPNDPILIEHSVPVYIPKQEISAPPTSLPVQNQNTISKIYSWKDSKGNTYCTANRYSIPKDGYISLEYMLLDRKNIYCWEDNKGKKHYANGLPSSQGENVYRLISIK